MSDSNSDTVYGGCEGPDAMYIKLVSSDDYEFIIKKQYVLTSPTITAMISGPGAYKEYETNEIKFKDIPSYALERICQYFVYKVKYTNSTTEIPEFPVEPDISLELLMAANFLDC